MDLVHLPFAHCANGNFLFVRLLTKKQMEVISLKRIKTDLPIYSMTNLLVFVSSPRADTFYCVNNIGVCTPPPPPSGGGKGISADIISFGKYMKVGNKKKGGKFEVN
jgi:hypothetical protein